MSGANTVKEALCLHATSDDLKFLNPVKTRLGRLLGARIQTCDFGNQHSCADGLLALKRATHKFVVIMAHGASTYIRSGEYLSRLTGEQQAGGNFLTTADLGPFSGKVVFCLSCDSNGLAEGSIAAGAQAFVGFDDIPFNKFDAAGNPIGSAEFVQHAQKLLATAICATLERFASGQSTLDETVAFLRFWICRDAVRFVREEKMVPKRREIAALMLRVKDGVRYHGPPGIRFV